MAFYEKILLVVCTLLIVVVTSIYAFIPGNINISKIVYAGIKRGRAKMFKRLGKMGTMVPGNCFTA